MPGPTLEEIRAAIRELFDARLRADGAVSNVLRMDEWSEWPEAVERQAWLREETRAAGR